MALRTLFGGSYLASCVFDLTEVLLPHHRTLTQLSNGASEGYVSSLIEYAIWLAGKKVNALDPTNPVPLPTMTTEVWAAVDQISIALEPCVYRILTPLQFTEQGMLVLRPDRLVYRRGEVWLCWKTHDLY